MRKVNKCHASVRYVDYFELPNRPAYSSTIHFSGLSRTLNFNIKDFSGPEKSRENIHDFPRSMDTPIRNAAIGGNKTCARHHLVSDVASKRDIKPRTNFADRTLGCGSVGI